MSSYTVRCEEDCVPRSEFRLIGELLLDLVYELI